MNEPQDGPSDSLVCTALGMSAGAGVVLGLMAFTGATLALDAADSPQPVWIPAGFAAAIGGALGGFLGLAGIALRRFAPALAAGIILPSIACGCVFGLMSVERGVPIWRGIGTPEVVPVVAFLTAVASFGAICAGTAAIVSRSPNWRQLRYSLRENVVMMIIWCVYFASLRVVCNAWKC